METALQNLAPELWVAVRDFTSDVGHVHSRMTIVRLANGRLLIFSPVPIDSRLRAEVEALGQPDALLAPNVFHHLFVGEWLTAFPGTRVFCTPGLVAKRSDIKFDGILGDPRVFNWSTEVDQVRIDGVPRYDEVVFYHLASRTLIVADITFNYPPEIAIQDPGGADGLGPHTRIRAATSDQDALRIKVLKWPFVRVIVTHGDNVETCGHELFRRGFEYLGV
jgi:Domain of unknown function (DUF4336)